MWPFNKQSKQFEKQLEQRWDRLYRIAYAWCHDPQLASDLTQDALAKALTKQHQLKKEEALDAWLYTILNNCWRDHCRRHKETIDIEDIIYAPAVYFDDENERAHIIAQVRNGVARLAPNLRQVVTLVDLSGMSYAEVATILDIPIGTVMSRLHRARGHLKEQLKNLDHKTDSSSNIRRIV